MAIQYVGGRGAGRAGSTSTVNVAISSGLTGGLAASASAGDLCVVTVSVGTAARQPACNIATPTGFTALTVQRTTATSFDANVQTCYKILVAGDITAGITIPSTGSTADGQAYTIQVFRGVHATTPMDATATFATGSGVDNRFDAAAITPVTAGAWILICGGGAAGSGTTLYTAPTDFTTNWLTFNGADTNDGTVGAGYYTGWTSGSYNPAAVTGGSVNGANSWGATTIALAPAATLNNYALDCQPGSVSVSGSAATLTKISVYLLDAQPAGYAITGLAATLARGLVFDAQPASVVVNGFDAAFTNAVSYTLDAQPGAFTITGANAALVADRVMSAAAGGMATTGADASIVSGRVLSADVGAIDVAGVGAGLVFAPSGAVSITADTGAMAVTGFDAGLAVTAAPDADRPPEDLGVGKTASNDDLDTETVRKAWDLLETRRRNQRAAAVVQAPLPFTVPEQPAEAKLPAVRVAVAAPPAPSKPLAHTSTPPGYMTDAEIIELVTLLDAAD